MAWLYRFRMRPDPLWVGRPGWVGGTMSRMDAAT